MLGRLQHGRVAAEDRRERLPGDVRQRRVERDQERRDADGAAQREHGAVRHRRRRRAAVRAAPLARDEESHLDRRVGLATRERERLAGLGGDDLARLVAALAEQLGDRPDDVARSTAVRAAHAGWAARAAATAAAASSAPERATPAERRRRRRAGASRATSRSPARRSSPATRFGTSAGITRPTSPRRRRGSPR